MVWCRIVSFFKHSGCDENIFLYKTAAKYELYMDEKAYFFFFEKMALKRMNAIFAPSRIMAQAVSKDIKKQVWVLETPYTAPRIEEDKGIYEIVGILRNLLKIHQGLYFVFAGNAVDRTIKQRLCTIWK